MSHRGSNSGRSSKKQSTGEYSYSGNSTYAYSSQSTTSTPARQGDQSKWRWNCCSCGFQNNSYNYDTSCASCGHHRDHNCQIWGLS
ncbi:hypothetical protein GGR51DRAFT_560222 [Nemania sp. FL0031]|nr:hypothetical protein GGR51DRAFT_560222 [Nemania sp. FL0031]